MTAKEFKKLKVGSHVAIISTGTEGIVHNIQRERGNVLVAHYEIGVEWHYVTPVVKEWFRYVELGKL